MIAREITLNLPDNLIREAEAIGLLTTESIGALLREEIKRRRVNKLFAAADKLAGLESPPLSEKELEAEIQAARAGRLSG